ncbi:uncharacterized protein LOC124816070 [Hydra vulgaris]|uniref:uncharacterized protein LOC124816070 n=1 Tax=Hydra vulgaris TaxID=6087 RepID=UPI001F5E5349|nr:uncharacterized protein LOC124816070 [Hydra vulgaris]
MVNIYGIDGNMYGIDGNMYGIDGKCDGVKAGQWLSNYLENRIQRVKNGKKFSSWKPITKSVPQGGGISPELFNSYPREITTSLKSEIYQFVDDITISKANLSLQVIAEKLKKLFQDTKDYCEKIKLTINTDKTQLIIFKPSWKQTPADYQILLDEITIKPENNVKLLGVTLDQHLTFKQQIESVIKKCHSSLGMLVRASESLPKKLLKLVYNGMVLSHMEFISSLYISIPNTHIKKLDVVQKLDAALADRRRIMQ